jgi:hypothetical protein
MPPNPDVLQIRLGALVTLVVVRDRENQEITVSIHEQGVVARRTSVTFPGDQGPRVGKFIAQAFHTERSRVTDDFPVEINPGDEITRPEGKPEK